MSSSVSDLVWFGAGIAVIALVTVGLDRWMRIGLGWFPLWALVRAAVQLSAIALILHGILSTPWTVVAFLALMLSTASFTAGSRLSALRRGRRIAVLAVLSGASVTIVVVFALRLVDLEVRYLVAVAGIVIGGCMSAATLSGRHFLHDARQRRDEVEGWLALGATPSAAYDDIGRLAVRESLLPNLDQSKSTGLVTLPGAFVGAIFGGASPLEAAQFQLVVLSGLGLAMTITAVIVTRLAGRTPYVVVD